jgi:1-acyl-sn-glycerol-3-phosphate acyltransferase
MPAYAPDPLDFQPPPLASLKRILAAQQAWFAPQFFGLENIDASRPALYVGNHTIMGGLDAPLMLAGLYEHTGVYLRALADRAHFMVPGWRSQLTKFGTVLGSRENCAALMQSGANILVFPGGGREVMKNKGESYQLIWKARTGFAAMAMEHGYDIATFAAVGADDAYDIHYDANDFRASRLGRLLQRSGIMGKYLRNGDVFNPLITGIPGTLIPRPEKLYFRFGPRISTQEYQQRHADKEAQWEVRRKVEEQVYADMDALFTIRAADQDWAPWRRRLTRRA